MKQISFQRRATSLAALLLFASILSCGREITGPENGVGVRRASMAVNPQFQRYELAASGVAFSASQAVPFERVRIVLFRADGITVALDTVINFPVGQDSVTLGLNVVLGASAPAEGEALSLSLGYLNAQGETVFKGGPVDVRARPAGSGSSTPQVVSVPVQYSGPGADAARVVISPDDVQATIGATVDFTASAFGGGANAIAGTPVVYSSTNPAIAAVDDPNSGRVRIVGARGVALVIAQLLTGQSDTAIVRVQPTPSDLLLLGGSNQTAVVGLPFNDSISVRVVASDGLPVSGATVGFAVTGGGGSVSPASMLTGADGLAKAAWTAGMTPGAATLSVSTPVNGRTVILTATQQPTAPARVTFTTAPVSGRAGAAMPVIVATVLDGTGRLASNFNGVVTLSLSGGATGAGLSGNTQVAAQAGVVRFEDIRIDRPGTGYIFTAAASGLTSAVAPAIEMTVGDARRIAFVESPDDGRVGVPITDVRVEAQDAFGNRVTSFTDTVSITLAANPGGDTLTVRKAKAVAGLAEFTDVSLVRVGTGYALRASAGTLPSTQSGSFAVRAGGAASLEIIGGNGQTAPAGLALADSIRVIVRDGFGNPVAGAGVDFALTGGGSVSPASVVTNAQGIAATRWTLGPSGTQSLAVSSPGITALSVAATIGGGAPTGPVVLFSGTSAMNIGRTVTAVVPIYISQAVGTPTVVTLTSLAPTTAAFTAPSVTIPAGQQSVNAPITGITAGTTSVILSSTYGADTVAVTVVPATLKFGRDGRNYSVSGADTTHSYLLLSVPAPAGGLTVRLITDDGSVAGLYPGKGDGVSDDCGYYYCGYDLRAATSVIAAVPETTTVFIKAGELAAQFIIVPRSGGEANIRAEASDFGFATAYLSVASNQLYLYMPDYVAAGLYGNDGEVELDRARGRTLEVRLVSRSPEVLGVDSLVIIGTGEYDSERFRTVGLTPGTSWLVASAPGFLTDSTLVTVTRPRFDVYSYYSPPVVGAVQRLDLSLRDSTQYYYGGDRLTDSLRAQVRYSTPGIVALENGTSSFLFGKDSDNQQQVRIKGVGAGSTWVIFEAPGVIADSVQITVGAPTLSFNNSYYNTTGRGLVNNTLSLIITDPTGASATSLPDAFEVSLESTTPGIVRIPPQIIFRASNNYSGSFPVEGLAVGTTTLRATAPGFVAAELSFSVTPTRFAGINYNSNYVLDSLITRSLRGELRDGTIRAWPATDTVPFILRSSDPSVLRVVDSVGRVSVGATRTNFLNFRTVGIGSAKLYFHSAVHGTDSLSITVSATGSGTRQLYASAYDGGGALRMPATYQVYRSTNDLTSDTVTVTSLRSRMRAAIPKTPFYGSYYAYISMIGDSLGVDTLIFSAPGYIPDTLTTSVEIPKVRIGSFGGSYVVGGRDDYVYGYSALPNGYSARQYGLPLTLKVTSTNPAVMAPDSAYVHIGAGSIYSSYFAVRYLSPGTARLVIEDSAGVLLPDTSYSVTVQPQTLRTISYPVTVGMRQKTEDYELYVARDYYSSDSLWVKLRTSAPGLVTVPDSVLIAPYNSYSYFSIAGRDTVGAVEVTVSAPGYVESSFVAIVGRPTLVIDDVYNLGAGYVNDYARVYALTNYGGYYREMAENLPVRLTIRDTTIATLISDTITILAGDYEADFQIRGKQVGRTFIEAADRRPVSLFRRAASGSEELEVEQLEINGGSNQLSLGVGQRRLDHYFWIDQPNDRDTIAVAIRGLGGKVGVSEDTIKVSNYYGYIDLDGLSAGVDTIVFTAAHFRPDTVVVTVGTGYLQVQNGLPNRMTQGDSVWVSVSLRTPSGSTGYAVASTEFQVTPNALAGIRLNNIAATSFTVASGNYIGGFWFKALTPGEAVAVISHPNYLPLRISIPVISLP